MSLSCEPVSETCLWTDSLMAGRGMAVRRRACESSRENKPWAGGAYLWQPSGSSICPPVSFSRSLRRAGLPSVPRAARPWRSHRPLPIGQTAAEAPGSCAHRARHAQILDRDCPQFLFSIARTRPPPPRPPNQQRQAYIQYVLRSQGRVHNRPSAQCLRSVCCE